VSLPKGDSACSHLRQDHNHSEGCSSYPVALILQFLGAKGKAMTGGFGTCMPAALLVAALVIPAQADERLHGHWIEIDTPVMQMTMRPDGRGEYLGAEMSWYIEGGRLAFVLGDGTTQMPLEPMDFAFDGEMLRIWHEELYPNPTFWQRVRQ
jgi:hypothetical protein